MHVDHITDLYNREYIEFTKNNKEKMNVDDTLKDVISELETLYNENIEALLLINFIPYQVVNIEEYMQILDDLSQNNKGKISQFYYKFKDALNIEYGYFKQYWESSFDQNKKLITSFEDHINAPASPLYLMNKYFGQGLMVNLSITLFKYGRGLAIEDNLIAAALIPDSSDEFFYTTLTAFHEFTHYVTDELIDDNRSKSEEIPINEILVMRFDFEFLKRHFIDYMPDYLKLSSLWAGMDISQENYTKVFELESELERKMLIKLNELEQFVI